ncbi:DUF309 domain-containing protein [Cohnella panacarvi]|uniref:DUF309 domain-containing protein n=1 Tax=Cohnella panacarvi TaxID=400776 RepID=UPI00054D0EDD|nr:DUF309 domain-containing protein [Cohnella panacarvi]
MPSLSSYPDEYIQYLAEYYGSRDYFECHEIMEEHWKEHPGSPQLGCWLVLIRIAVAQYHARRGNRTGALKLMGKAAEETDPIRFGEIGIDGAKLKKLLGDTYRRWSASPVIAYEDLDLPFTDSGLLEQARSRSLALGYPWGIRGSEAGDSVIHRHKLRDRSDVIEAREQSVKRKALSRSIPNTDTRQ